MTVHFSFDSPDVAEAAGNAGSNVNKQNDKPDDDMVSLSSENSEKELDPVVEKFDAYLAEFIAPDEKTSAAVYPSLAKGVNKMFDEGMGFETFWKKIPRTYRGQRTVLRYITALMLMGM